MVEAAALAAVSAALVAALAAFLRASRRASALEPASPQAIAPLPSPPLLSEPEAAPQPDRLGELMLGLERVRVEREWSEVAGPGVPPPVAWDGTLAGFVAVELAVIREVIGTPGQLTGPHPGPGPAGVPLAAAARLACELLRVLARSGEEMNVTVGPSALTVEQPGSPAAEDLARLAALARSAGGDLSCEADGEGATTRLVYPGGRRPEDRRPGGGPEAE